MDNVFASVQSELAVAVFPYTGDFSFKTMWSGSGGNIAISRDGGKTSTTYTGVPAGVFFGVGVGKTTTIVSYSGTGLVLGNWSV